LSEPEIAERLRVSAATASRHLKAIHESWGTGFRAEFDPLREIHEAIALYKVLEAAALEELVRLETEGDSRTAAESQMHPCRWRDVCPPGRSACGGGLLNAAELRAQNTLPRAAEIRAAVEAAQLEPGNMIRDGAPAWRPGDRESSLSLPTELTGCC
jgi:hypothetical protein